jgi:hypothetical protein
MKEHFITLKQKLEVKLKNGNTIQDFGCVNEKELLTAVKWQHVEADYEPRKLFKENMNNNKKKILNVLSPHPVNHYVMKNPHQKNLVLSSRAV